MPAAELSAVRPRVTLRAIGNGVSAQIEYRVRDERRTATLDFSVAD
jgi:hypothetical protein